MMNRFDVVAEKFEALCRQYAMPVPRVVPSLATDPCDFTSAEEVRLNVEAAGEIDADYHARHVFGHYLCDLHCSEPSGNQDWADPIADLIAQWTTSHDSMVRLTRVFEGARSCSSSGSIVRMSLVQPMSEGANLAFWHEGKEDD